MNYLKIILKGILLGVVSIAIPGLSASTVAIMIGVYSLMIDSISGILKNFKKNFPFLISLILGFFIGALVGAVIIKVVYELFPLIVVLLIVGCILGSIPKEFKKLIPGFKKPSNIITLLITIALLFSYSLFLKEGIAIDFANMLLGDYIHLFFVGIFTSITLVIPGVDFAVVFLALGYYSSFINVAFELIIFNHFAYNLSIFGVYLLGYGIGAFLFSNIIKYLMHKFQSQTIFASFAFILTAPIIVLKTCIIDNPSFVFVPLELAIGIIVMIVCFILIFLITFKPKNNKTETITETPMSD